MSRGETRVMDHPCTEWTLVIIGGIFGMWIFFPALIPSSILSSVVGHSILKHAGVAQSDHFPLWIPTAGSAIGVVVLAPLFSIIWFCIANPCAPDTDEHWEGILPKRNTVGWWLMDVLISLVVAILTGLTNLVGCEILRRAGVKFNTSGELLLGGGSIGGGILCFGYIICVELWLLYSGV